MSHPRTPHPHCHLLPLPCLGAIRRVVPLKASGWAEIPHPTGNPLSFEKSLEGGRGAGCGLNEGPPAPSSSRAHHNSTATQRPPQTSLPWPVAAGQPRALQAAHPASPCPSLQQLLPGDGPGEDLPLQPEVVVDLELLGQVHPLAQHALQAVIHRHKVGVAVGAVVAPRVEALDAGTQGTLLRLEIPRAGIQVWGRDEMGQSGAGDSSGSPKPSGCGLTPATLSPVQLLGHSPTRLSREESRG